MGGTGNVTIAEPFSIFTPTLLLGKGFGDLPEGAKYLRPLALTGVLGTAFPTQMMDQDSGTTIPRVAIWGLTLQYDVHYLQSHVKNIGLGEPYSRLVPLVEFPMQVNWNGQQK